MRLLIVDDSVVFRTAIKSALSNIPDIEIAGIASNGKIALQKLSQSSIDLVILDMEMPEMGGLETIRAIKSNKFQVRIIVFSSYTKKASEASLEALKAGADDFVTKPLQESPTSPEEAVANIRTDLLPKVLQFFQPPKETLDKISSNSNNESAFASKVADLPKPHLHGDILAFKPSAIVIGCSTGGPPALEEVLKNLPNPSRVPIFITQHMPPLFTASLAKRIYELTGIQTAEAIHGEQPVPNRIYIAPGNFHMLIEQRGNQPFIVLTQNPLRNSVRPAVDYLFESAANIYGPKTLGIILTGMGEDGLVGARAIKQQGGRVMIQNRESCVVFGMPGAVFEANLFDEIGNLQEINRVIKVTTVTS